MSKYNQIKRDVASLPHEKQLIIRDVCTDAGIISLSNNKNINDVFFDLVTNHPEFKINEKFKRAVLSIYNRNNVELAMHLCNEAHQAYLKDKKHLDEIESELEKFFRSKGWVLKTINNSPFWVKSIIKDSFIFKQHVLHGIEQVTNQYVYVFGDYDKLEQDKEIREETLKFDKFSDLKEVLK